MKDHKGIQKLIETRAREKNTALIDLFGIEKKDEQGQIGKVIFNDCYIPIDALTATSITHNTIDRFTGGTIKGALFSEMVTAGSIELSYLIDQKIEPEHISLLEKVLNDIGGGKIPLGGKSSKGYGRFKKIEVHA